MLERVSLIHRIKELNSLKSADIISFQNEINQAIINNQSDPNDCENFTCLSIIFDYLFCTSTLSVEDDSWILINIMKCVCQDYKRVFTFIDQGQGHFLALAIVKNIHQEYCDKKEPNLNLLNWIDIDRRNFIVLFVRHNKTDYKLFKFLRDQLGYQW